jgi:predicted double-glycine peptidase
MKPWRIPLVAALIAALFVLAPVAFADCPPGNPECELFPPESEEVNPDPGSGVGLAGEVASPGPLLPVQVVIPMPLPRLAGASPVMVAVGAPANLPRIEIPLRYQDQDDVSCGVQALGMALDGLEGAAPTSPALLGFLQDQGMMYDFGTGVEELAYAAQSFGYRGSYAFHGATLEDLAAQLVVGSPVVVSLGANGEGVPGHFVTVTGISADGKWVAYNDPTLGRKMISAEEFTRLWGLQGNSGVAVLKEVPAGAPDYSPWVALMAGVMALVSMTPLGARRQGVGGRVDSGGGGGKAAPKSAPKPAPKTAAKPKPKPAVPAAVTRAEEAFEANPPPPPATPPPPGVDRAERFFEANPPPEPAQQTTAASGGSIITSAYEHFILTDDLILRGGVGSPVSYAQKAEGSYTGHSYGGQSPLPMKAVGLLNYALVLARDATSILDWMVEAGWNHPDASGTIFYEEKEIEPVLSPDPRLVPDRGVPYEPIHRSVIVPGGTAINATAVQLYNQSHEALIVQSVWVDVLPGGTSRRQSHLVFPPGQPILACGDFGEVSPGDISRIGLDEAWVPPGSSATVTISVVSASGRWGTVKQDIAP